jgi:N utilization substance protein A
MDELDTKQFILTMRQIAEEKNLDFAVVQEAIEHALAAAYRKDHGTRDQNVRVALNAKNGTFRTYIVKDVVEVVENPEAEITLAEAKKENKDIKLGEQLEKEVKAENFGRVAAQTAKQVILQKLREAERGVIHEEFSGRIGSILNGTVQRVEPRMVYVDLGKAQGILPASEQIPGEHYSIGHRMRVYLRDVENATRGPQLVLSRANTQFVSLLFEREVPEMESGAVEIRAIAREAGVRTKLAVASTMPGVDPVGTFVGGHGTRVQAVMNEIGEEKIDIVPFDDNPANFISSALAPTKISRVTLNEEEKKATVSVPEDQLSVAIGKNGQNVRLASKLTGWQIDIVGSDGKVEQVEDKPKTSGKPKKIASKEDIESSLIDSINKATSEDESKKN